MSKNLVISLLNIKNKTVTIFIYKMTYSLSCSKSVLKIYMEILNYIITLQTHFFEEYIIMMTIQTIRTTNTQKDINFLLVSCWYTFAYYNSFLPSLKLSFTRDIVAAAIFSFIPCSKIILLVYSVILLICIIIFYNSFSYCFSSYKIFLLT